MALPLYGINWHQHVAYVSGMRGGGQQGVRGHDLGMDIDLRRCSKVESERKKVDLK